MDLKQRIQEAAERQLSDPLFAEFCVTHVTDSKYAFLYGGSDHATFTRIFRELAAPRKRLRDLTNPAEEIFRELEAARAEESRSCSCSVPGARSFYFTSRNEFDEALGMLYRAVGWRESAADADAESFVEFMLQRRTRTACFLHLLQLVSLHQWKLEQQGGDEALRCHVRRGTIFYMVASLLLQHINASKRDASTGLASLVYEAAFLKHMPLIVTLASKRCTTEGMKDDLVVQSNQVIQRVAETVESLASGKLFPLRILECLQLTPKS
jgi:hypothetical protein